VGAPDLGHDGPVSERDRESSPALVNRPPELARTFNQIPDDYEARPGYPRWIFDVLVERGALRAGAAVLEIGPGTGQATLPMLELGADVTAVEPGAALASRLTERAAGQKLQVIVSRFEEASLPESAFDLVASATAFHWVDPTAGAAKCARVVRDDGWLALWWTIWGDPDRPDPFHDALTPFMEVHAPQLLDPAADPRAYLRDLAARAEHIDATGAFGPISHEVLQWEGEHDPVGLRRLFATYGGWIALPEPLQSEMLGEVERLASEDFGGTVRRPYQTVLYLTQRLPR
jgi:SAM-dependent methyltransferase